VISEEVMVSHEVTSLSPAHLPFDGTTRLG
jgi:hypothetical protein